MKSLLFLLLALSLAACGDTPVAPEAPAEAPAPALTAAPGTAGAGAFVRRALAVATVDDEIINEEGEISYSSDALGTLDATGTIQVQKPAGGTLRKAIFAAASEPFTCTLENGLIRLDGTPISWNGSAAQQLPFGCGTNYHADVTDLIRMKLNAAAEMVGTAKDRARSAAHTAAQSAKHAADSLTHRGPDAAGVFVGVIRPGSSGRGLAGGSPAGSDETVALGTSDVVATDSGLAAASDADAR